MSGLKGQTDKGKSKCPLWWGHKKDKKTTTFITYYNKSDDYILINH
jgi:hypothetical protein